MVSNCEGQKGENNIFLLVISFLISSIQLSVQEICGLEMRNWSSLVPVADQTPGDFTM